MNSGTVQLANFGRYRGTGRGESSSQGASKAEGAGGGFDTLGEEDEEASDTTPFLINSSAINSRSNLTANDFTGPLHIDGSYDRYASPVGKDGSRAASDGESAASNPYAAISATPSKHAYSILNEVSVANRYYGRTESQSFDHEESAAWRDHQKLTNKTKREMHQRVVAVQWFLTVLTGLGCGALALIVSLGTRALTMSKLRLFHAIIENEKSGSAFNGAAFMFLLMANQLLASLAWGVVYLEPVAGGSGIPEVKCYLNGLDIPRLMSAKTLVYKVAGIIFSCSSGLPLGKEGSMVHAGSVVASVLSQGHLTLGRCLLPEKYVKPFRNDKEKRDFVACGTSAGVSAAFGSPVGGVLFALEEGASFWSTKLTLRCFLSGMMALFVLIVYKAAGDSFGHSVTASMFSFGNFFSLRGEKSNFSVWELSVFVFVGIMGGLIGACFNSAQQQIFQIRKSFYDRPLLKYFEVVCIVTVMTAISYWLPTLWGACVPLPNAAYSSAISVQEQNLIKELVPLYCSSDTHYNDLGSLFLNDGDTCIRLLYHFREEGNQNDITFSSSALFLFFVPYIVMSCFTFGSGVPAGTFVPSILSGAAFGRLVGHLLHRLDSTSGTFADGGTYALIGSGAVSGGITRLTISLVVVILEATGDMQYLLPLIVVVMAAVFVGKCFTPGLYDIYIYNRNLHFLEEEDSLSSDIDTSGHSVSEVMLRNPICLVPCVRVDELLSVLEAEPRSHFAVVSDRYSNTLVGTISRKVLLILLKKKAFVLKPMISRQASKDLSLEEIEELHSESPDLATLILSFSQSDRRQYLDMSFYIEDVPYIIQSHASVGRAYRMFRSLGLSHLVVVSSDRANFGERFYCDKSSARVDADARIVVGIIFRHNLLQSNLSSLCKFE